MNKTRTNDALAPPSSEPVLVLRQQPGTHWQVSVYSQATGQRVYFDSLPALLTYLSVQLGPDAPPPVSPLQS